MLLAKWISANVFLLEKNRSSHNFFMFTYSATHDSCNTWSCVLDPGPGLGPGQYPGSGPNPDPGDGWGVIGE